MNMSELLIATNNAGKVKELESLLGGLPITLRSLSDLGITTEVDETGSTFDENAALKAVSYASIAGVPTLADDSGLVIDHLDGRPGVHSARYAGARASDSDRVRKVLAEMKDDRDRSARFVCVAALADSSGSLVTSVEGICEGSVVDVPRGSSGFGYDPIFLPAGFDKTFAELDLETKNRISHRAQAIVKIIPFLRGFFDI
jgi:XTP/dITP diphosphohydrolase